MSVLGAGGSNPKRRRPCTEQVVPGSDYDNHSRPSSQRRAARDFSETDACFNPFEDRNYPIPDFDNVYSKMRHPSDGFKVSDRRWRFMNYPKCFIGSEAVQWMTEHLKVNREKAVHLGQRLMDAGIIHHVTQSEPFADDYYFFRFQEDNDTNVLNLKRVWDPKIKTRPAVEVSQDLLTRLACLCEEYRERIVASRNANASRATDPGPSPTLRISSSREEKISENSEGMHFEGKESSPNLQDSSTRATLSTRILKSPLLGGVPGSVISTLTPYMPCGGSPNPLSTQKAITQSGRTSTSGDDIDYTLLAKSEDFRQYTLAAAELQHVQLVGLSSDEILAFFVNVYNTLCLHGYVAQEPPSNMYRRWVFFRSLSYRIAGLDMTLDDIEHGVLRGNKRPPMLRFMQQLRPSDPKCQYVLNLRDGRIHFVISAGTRSDPPVRILNGENLQEELHDATIEFLGCSVKVDVERKVVTLPRIFLWYAEDFPTPETALLAWVARYLPAKRSDELSALLAEGDTKPSVVYENFDWNNADARFEASVIRRKRRKLERACAAPSTPKLMQFPFAFGGDSGFGVSDTLTTPLLANHPLHTGRGPSSGRYDVHVDGDGKRESPETRLSDIQFSTPKPP